MKGDSKTKYEFKLFDIIIRFGLVIWPLRLVKELVYTTTYTVAVLDGFQLLSCILILILIRKGVARAFLIRIYCIEWLLFFPLYWINQGGFDGPMTYVYFSLMVMYNGILRRRFRYVLISLLSIMCFLLVVDSELSNSIIDIVPYDHHGYLLMEMDFVINTILVALIVIYIKTNFDEKRGQIKAHNQSLEWLNIELSEKRDLLKNQQEEIMQIRNNLEQLIKERTAEIEKKTKELEEYAYVNAHHIRGPLTNILSIINLLSSVPELDDENLPLIKKHAEELDMVIKKINMLIY